MKLSVVILTHNSSDVIRGCLNSIKTADEIIIIDDYSSDSTLSLAKLFQPTIIQNKLSGFSHQRNLGLKQVKSDWVLFLDSDERVPGPLFKEIVRVIKNSPYSAYQIKRLNYFFTVFWATNLLSIYVGFIDSRVISPYIECVTNI